MTLEIKRSRKVHVNTGNYEFIEVSAEMTFDPDTDVPEDAEPSDWAAEVLTVFLEPEMEALADVAVSNSLLTNYR